MTHPNLPRPSAWGRGAVGALRVLGLCLALASSCRSPRTTPEPPPAGDAPGTPAGSATPDPGGAGILSFVEIDQDGGVHDVRRGFGIADISSRIEVGIDKDGLRRWIVAAYQIPDIPQSELNELDRIHDWAQRGLAAIPALRTGLQEFARARREANQLEGDDRRAKLEEAKNALQAALDAPATLATEIQEQALEDNGILGPDFVARVEARWTNESPGFSMVDSYRILFEEAAVEADAIRRRLDAAVAAQAVHIQLGAWHVAGGVPSPRHLEGFDEYPDQERYVVDRWAVLPTDEQLQQIEELEQEARDVDDASDEVGDALEGAIRAAAQSLVASVEACSGDLEGQLRTAELEFKQMEADARALVDDYRERVRAVENAVEDLVERAEEIVELYVTGNFRERGSITAWISGAKEDLASVQALAEEVVTRLGALTDTTAVDRTFADVDATVRQRAADAVATVQGCRETISGEVVDLSRGLLMTLGIANANLEINLDALEFGSEVTRHDLSTLPRETFLELELVGKRDEGDVVAFKLGTGQLDPETGEAKGSPRTVEVQRIEMQRVLVHFDTTVGLIFANPNGRPINATWQLAPSYSVLLKKGSRSSALYNRLLDPGIGINIAAVDFDNDETPELGVGAVLSVVRDYVQVGYGYNVFENRWYGFFGLSLPLPGGSLPMPGSGNSADI